MKKLYYLFLLVPILAFQVLQTKAKLEIKVMNNLGAFEEGAKVQVYKEKANYDKLTNPTAEGTTNSRGKIFFGDLETIPYYIYVEKGDKNNIGNGEMTDTLVPRKYNRLTVIISDF